VNLSFKVNVQQNIRQSLRLKQNALDFLEADQHSRSARINQGKLVHELFSFIETEADLEAALIQMRQQGKLGHDDVPDLRQHVTQLLNQSMVSEWFDGTYRILNEKTFILPGFELLRPDRIMVGKGKVLVVDYKVSETVHSAHHKQVMHYCESIRQMGHEKVEGYLWYLKSNQIIDVYKNE
ncbi:MAG: Dna2/Cas4 domain-containing protein, partial [Prolixibacteraceae bacterium]|nr:Dna2/Cas4 domain-containing protein [Prolixibacteraceae bacterium]